MSTFTQIEVNNCAKGVAYRFVGETEDHICVMIKVFGVHILPGEIDSRRLKAFCQRLSQLKHKNLLDILGLADDDFIKDKFLSLIIPYLPTENINLFLEKLLREPERQAVPVASLKRRWVEEIAVGLKYLHDKGVTHGILHTGNVLIDDQGSVRLTDYGLEWIAEASQPPGGPFHPFGGPLRCMTPEVHDPEAFGLPIIIKPTLACDMYSYGASTCYEIYAYKEPFAELTLLKAYRQILGGVRPTRPVTTNGRGTDDVSDFIWSIMTRFWVQQAKDRPSVHEVVEFFCNREDALIPRNVVMTSTLTSEFYDNQRGNPPVLFQYVV
ncbi:hypothetical protein EUX98_g5916 [Antrodiella citrinella]|uniref:Protein kinase domain-containing protein n=1 Tax=Antrodiella citrinella TaxID=2447956 RepID=A0A4S4MQA3_9APHY|nr:hypothetical protein EUX98_g5916 [Antrodiella citrinella]